MNKEIMGCCELWLRSTLRYRLLCSGLAFPRRYAQLGSVGGLSGLMSTVHQFFSLVQLFICLLLRNAKTIFLFHFAARFARFLLHFVVHTVLCSLIQSHTITYTC